MAIQAVVDIDVDIDFGLVKALRICSQCGLRNVVSDSVKRAIHIVITDNVEEKIACLSSIKGFFIIDLRLFIELCSLDHALLKKLGINPVPRALYEQSRVIGYIHVDNKVCILEKTSRQGVVMVRVLKSKTLPTFIEPSHYLIQAPNTIINEKFLESLNILKKVNSTLTPLIMNICSKRSE
jgi:hypothetical protein